MKKRSLFTNFSSYEVSDNSCLDLAAAKFFLKSSENLQSVHNKKMLLSYLLSNSLRTERQKERSKHGPELGFELVVKQKT